MKKMKLFFLLVLTSAFTATVLGQAGITYEKRTAILNAPKCNASEVYLKKKIKAQLATFYEEYPYIAVDFSSFKGQNGYTDKADATRIVYPFKIEMLVHLKRNIMKEGKEHTEYVTWKYDSVYEYATKPGKKCDFKLVPSSQITLVTKQVFLTGK